jgi:hypothetical protein
MDPEETWKRINEILKEEDGPKFLSDHKRAWLLEELTGLLGGWIQWKAKGGFDPNWRGLT